MNDPRDDSSDRELGELYRSLSTEQAPPQLDRQVLRLAKRGSARGRHQWWALSWFPAAACSAVVAVVVVVFAGQGWFNATPVGDGDNPGYAEGLTGAAEDGGRRLRDLGNEAARVTAAPGVPDAYSQRGEARSRHCSEAQTRTRRSWLDCIASLEAAGRSADAAEESTRLLDAYPDERR